MPDMKQAVHKCLTLAACALVALGAQQAHAQDLILDGQRIELSGKSILIDPVTGDLKVTSKDGALVCTSGTVNTSSPTISAVQISPASITEGQNSTISVTYTTQKADSCTGTGSVGLTSATDWATSQPLQSPNGEAGFDPSFLSAGTYDVGLRCTNANGETQATRATLQVNSGSADPTCTNNPPPSGTSRDSAIIVGSGTLTQTYESIYGTFPSSGNEDLDIISGQYAALKFNSGNPPASTAVGGQFSLAEGGPATYGAWVVSISQCPGDFGPHLDQTDCRQWLDRPLTETFRWRYADHPMSGRCHLERNTDYYLNLIPATSMPAGGQPTPGCTSGTSRCGGVTSVKLDLK